MRSKYGIPIPLSIFVNWPATLSWYEQASDDKHDMICIQRGFPNASLALEYATQYFTLKNFRIDSISSKTLKSV